MKWFFALNEASGNFAHFADMIKVAVYSATKHTRLVPHFLYDGQENELTAWLREKQVEVIFRRSFLYPHIEAAARKLEKPHILSIAPGAFLRTEIPALAAERGWLDECVLYTDCDIMFRDDVVEPLQQFRPRYFAVAAEDDPNNNINANTGVMLMNPRGLMREDPKFRAFMQRHIEALCQGFWDQTAYQWYFNLTLRRLLALGFPESKALGGFYRLYRRGLCRGPLWQTLPIEYNWKPYWENFDSAKIIHFHGPKPYERTILSVENPPEHLLHLVPVMRGRYFDLCALWEEALENANRNDWTANTRKAAAAS